MLAFMCSRIKCGPQDGPQICDRGVTSRGLGFTENTNGLSTVRAPCAVGFFLLSHVVKATSCLVEQAQLSGYSEGGSSKWPWRSSSAFANVFRETGADHVLPF